MIFLIAGRIGTGTHHFIEKMQNAGYHDVLPELVALDGHPIPKFNDNLPSYASVEPERVTELLTAFPNELFHVIYIHLDEDDNETTRRSYYISEYGNPEEAPAMFDMYDQQESTQFDEFEDMLRLQNPDTPDNLRAVHTVTNNLDETTQREWVDYFINFHRMYLRLVKITKLGMKLKVVNVDENNHIILFYRSKTDGSPTKDAITPEKFADILIGDNNGLAMIVKNVLEKAESNDLVDILSN